MQSIDRTSHYIDAITALCRMEMENRRQRDEAEDSNHALSGLVSASELYEQMITAPFEDAVSDPVHFAVRVGCRKIAEAISKEGGFDLMHRVLYGVVERLPPEDEGEAISFLDNAFDGIGGWVA